MTSVAPTNEEEQVVMSRVATSTWARESARTLFAGSSLLGRFSYLLMTQIVLVSTGLVYWAATARLVPAHDVGIAAAAIAMATLLSTLGILGIGSLMLVALGEVDPGELRATISTGVVLAGSIVGVLCAGSLAFATYLGPSIHIYGRALVPAILFVCIGIGLATSSVVDSAAIGLRKGRAQLARNSIQALLRLGVLFVAAIVFDFRDASALLLAWTLSIGVSLACAPALLKLPESTVIGFPARVALVRRLGGLALRHHVLNLAISSVTLFLPVIAALLILPQRLAYFSVAQLIAGAALLPPALLAMTLFAETTGDELRLRQSIRRTIPVGLGCCLLVLVIVEPFAPEILRIFGAQYAAHGTVPLRLLVLGGIPYVVKDHFVAIRRAQQRLIEAARYVACSTVFELGSAAAGGVVDGTTGLCLAWLIATSLEALVFAPTVISTGRLVAKGA